VRAVLAPALMALLLAACDAGEALPSSANASSSADEAPALIAGEWRVVPERHARYLFLQGSREGHAPADSYFAPDVADIIAMETALTARLTRDGYFAREADTVRQTLVSNGLIPAERIGNYPVTLETGWAREYLGIVRDGERSIIGNYALKSAPLTSPAPDYDPTIPAVIDDGGPLFFGAEYRLADRTISFLSFNGSP
jgi:hypothetical protein